MAQRDTVLHHLRHNPELTPLQAMGVYGIHRLPARIYELKQEGYNIAKTTQRDGMGRNYASYSLVE